VIFASIAYDRPSRPGRTCSPPRDAGGLRAWSSAQHLGDCRARRLLETRRVAAVDGRDELVPLKGLTGSASVERFEDAWRSDLALLDEMHRALRESVRCLPACARPHPRGQQLHAFIGCCRPPASRRPIQLLKRLARASMILQRLRSSEPGTCAPVVAKGRPLAHRSSQARITERRRRAPGGKAPAAMPRHLRASRHGGQGTPPSPKPRGYPR
jgi:hypothetical protein